MKAVPQAEAESRRLKGNPEVGHKKGTPGGVPFPMEKPLYLSAVLQLRDFVFDLEHFKVDRVGAVI